MSFTSNFIRFVYSSRMRQVENFQRNPHKVQRGQLERLIKKSLSSRYLREHGIFNIEKFRELPVVEYEEIADYITEIKKGKQNILTGSQTRWFAKSSGTTNDKSKYIPVTRESLYKCQYLGGIDVIGFALNMFPETKALSGKALTLGGSHKMVNEGGGMLCGDLSAIMIENTPSWFSGKRVPSKETALTPNFEEKVNKICLETVNENVTSFAGVPSWNMVLMNRILEYTGKNNMHEVWPDMSLFVHGGVSFKPYREQYKKLFPDSGMNYIETYNASEGFFSIQDRADDDSMLLMLDYGIYYEFIPLNSLADHSTIVPLDGVKPNETYAMVITTSGGLWRYIIGDTVEFTSINPYRIKITGRTKQFLNVFGEEIVEENVTRALVKACEHTGAVVADYTIAPVFMEGREKGSHQWVIEFEKMPDSINKFAEIIDTTLQSLNSDYEAKRSNNTTLNAPLLTVVPGNTFYRWMQERGKVGGQNKVPRLSNQRDVVEQILKLL